ncbi:universal stress protein, partial [Vibrio parahaemolyticus]|nr:universal stress protein [Vibrio parahaemolyticus]
MYKQILVPVDLNDQGFSDRAVELAVWQAKQANAQIHLLTVLPGIHMSMVATYFPKDAAAKMKQDVKQQLKTFAHEHIAEDVVYQVHVAEGKAY